MHSLCLSGILEGGPCIVCQWSMCECMREREKKVIGLSKKSRGHNNQRREREGENAWKRNLFFSSRCAATFSKDFPSRTHYKFEGGGSIEKATCSKKMLGVQKNASEGKHLLSGIGR